MMCQTICSYQDRWGDCIYTSVQTPCQLEQGLDYIKELRAAGEKEKARAIVQSIKRDRANLKIREVQ